MISPGMSRRERQALAAAVVASAGRTVSLHASGAVGACGATHMHVALCLRLVSSNARHTLPPGALPPCVPAAHC